jgi:ABC-type spermidine/putrescine transport system permease subunit II
MTLSSAASTPRLATAAGEPGRSRYAFGTLALALPALMLLLLLFVLPLGRLFALSFAGGSLKWYAKALTGGLYTTILLRTFEIAAINLELAARGLGAGRLAAVRTVTLADPGAQRLFGCVLGLHHLV